MVNRGHALGTNQWESLPHDLQMGWKIPIQYMMNFTRLREVHPIITVEQYLRMHNLPPELEASNGAWNREAYHTQASVFAEDQSKRPTLFSIQNMWYDPWTISRVDYIPEAMKARGKWSPEGGDHQNGAHGFWPETEMSSISQYLHQGLGQDTNTLQWDRAVQLLRETQATSRWDLNTDEGITEALQANGWEVLYTFHSVCVGY